MLQQLTTQIYEECELSWMRFMQFRDDAYEPDFFNEVKPYADRIHNMLLDWQQQAEQFIVLARPKYVHAIQIANAVEQIDQFVVQSFYIKTSKKRLYQSIQAAKYTCETLLSALRDVADE
ncbi:YppE family protein [Kurthia huakuii]|uniref:YppE family protein n=1 Tax=Kurthia huakuii TaxID=1421019 RepID=UPI0004970CFE|nr:YppE family protein [Kurthia huakuii]MBM7699064.1 hypothetical protein [Kurthia huakuii]